MIPPLFSSGAYGSRPGDSWFFPYKRNKIDYKEYKAGPTTRISGGFDPPPGEHHTFGSSWSTAGTNGPREGSPEGVPSLQARKKHDGSHGRQDEFLHGRMVSTDLEGS